MSAQSGISEELRDYTELAGEAVYTLKGIEHDIH